MIKEDINLTDHSKTQLPSAILSFVENVNSDKLTQFVWNIGYNIAFYCY